MILKRIKYFQGKGITSLQPHVIAKKEIARTWQKIRPFMNMSVLDAVVSSLSRISSVIQAGKRAINALKLAGFPGGGMEC